MKNRIVLIAIFMLALLGAGPAAAESRDVYIVQVADAISPGTADYIKSSIKTAEKRQAACIVIQLDTPG
ncbi:MAG: hypothetical protein QNJ58_21595, partial [Desulfobacterales bacterium]|nr:hypothetical protein [Desulfobacterales bacterium]